MLPTAFLSNKTNGGTVDVARGHHVERREDRVQQDLSCRARCTPPCSRRRLWRTGVNGPNDAAYDKQVTGLGGGRDVAIARAIKGRDQTLGALGSRPKMVHRRRRPERLVFDL